MFSAVLSKQSKGSELLISCFSSNFEPALKVNLLSQYWQNGSTEVRGKLLALNCDILKTARRKQFKFGENAF